MHLIATFYCLYYLNVGDLVVGIYDKEITIVEIW